MLWGQVMVDGKHCHVVFLSKCNGYWGLVGSKGIESLYNVFPDSLLNTSKLDWSQTAHSRFKARAKRKGDTHLRILSPNFCRFRVWGR